MQPTGLTSYLASHCCCIVVCCRVGTVADVEVLVEVGVDAEALLEVDGVVVLVNIDVDLEVLAGVGVGVVLTASFRSALDFGLGQHLSAAGGGQAPRSVCSKDRARANIICTPITRDTSHFETWILKDVAPRNIFCI